MDDFDIPIFKKSYELYKVIYSYRITIPKQDRYTLWQRCENLSLDIIEGILFASQISKQEKLSVLKKISLKLNFLRVFLRLSKETKALNLKKYIVTEEMIDEVGKMLGGWLKSISKSE